MIGPKVCVPFQPVRPVQRLVGHHSRSHRLRRELLSFFVPFILILHSHDRIANFFGKGRDYVVIRGFSGRSHDGFSKNDSNRPRLFRQKFRIDDSCRQHRHLGLNGDTGKALMKGADRSASGSLPFRENPQNRTIFKTLKDSITALRSMRPRWTGKVWT